VAGEGPWSRYFIAAVGLAFALASGSVVFAADGWSNAHKSNDAAPGWVAFAANGWSNAHKSDDAAPGWVAFAADGWSNASNGYGYYHESNGSATISSVQGG
jgi:hypothetical protein